MNSFDTFINKRMMPPVMHLDMIMTTKCNLYCTYCFMEKKQPRSMSPDVLERAVAFHSEYCRHLNPQVTYIGGEPLIEIGLIEHATALYRGICSKQGKTPGFSLTTNGTLLDQTMAERLAGMQIKYLLSIDGSEHSHNKYRHFADGAPTWKLITSRLPELKRYQPWQGARVTVNPDTVCDLAEGVKCLFECGVNQFIIGAATGVEWKDEEITAYEEQMLKVAQYHNEMKAKKAPIRLTIFEYDTEKPQDRKRGQWGCGAGRGRLSVDPAGTITGCAKIQGCNNGNGIFVLGNIFEGITNLRERYALNWDNLQLRSKCRDCDIADRCSSGCPAVNFTETGNPFIPSDHNSKFTRIYHRLEEVLNACA